MIFQINTSDGGVPKRSEPVAVVTKDGIVTDRQRNLKVHGGPERALCLYSLESILALQQEGHPIYPGATGENITLSGIDYSRLKPGMQLQLGDQVIVEITSYTVPCKNIAEAFHDGKFIRISQDHYPGWSRLYAKVVQEGTIRTADPVTTLEQPETKPEVRHG